MEDLSFLVQETFKELKHFQAPTLPRAPGIVYHLQKSSLIFVIRAISTHDIAETCREVLDQPEQYPRLRMVEASSDQLKYFETEYFTQAESLQKLITNNRYPLYEENLCNMSDPGFSWWLVETDQGLILTKKLVSIDLSKTYKLGDLGNPDITMFMLSKLANLLKNLPGDWKVFTSDQRFVIQGPKQHFFFELWRNFLLEGHFSQDFEHALEYLSHRTNISEEEHWAMKDFLKDLAMTRFFWKKIYSQLESGRD